MEIYRLLFMRMAVKYGIKKAEPIEQEANPQLSKRMGGTDEILEYWEGNILLRKETYSKGSDGIVFEEGKYF